VLLAIGKTEFAARCAPPIRQVNLCGSSENTSCTNTTAPATPTNWIPAAANTQAGDALPIADRTPLTGQQSNQADRDRDKSPQRDPAPDQPAPDAAARRGLLRLR
jgi:hypothetical protein